VTERLGGRKFLITLGVFLAGTAIDLLTERGLSENLKELFMAGAIGFGIVNVGASAVYSKEKKEQAPPVDTSKLEELIKSIPAPPGDSSEILTSINGLANQNAHLTKLVADLAKLQGETYKILMAAVQGGQNQQK
jgi:hypothetical protein